MKRMILAILLTISLSGCSGIVKANKSFVTNSGVKAQAAEGYGSVHRVEIRKFTYSGEKIIQNRCLDKIVILDKAQDIKMAMDIFDLKIQCPGIVDRLASEYRMDIIKNDGSKAVYDFGIGDNMIVFFDNQSHAYKVENPECVKAMMELTETSYREPLTQEEAISMLKDDYPDFPSSTEDTISKEFPIGGPEGAKADVKFSTTAKKIDEYTYEITFTKDWGIAVNGKYARSLWKYSVISNSVCLIESTDNEKLPAIIK